VAGAALGPACARSPVNSILLSLCIPTYNRLPYLRELLPGVVAELARLNEAELNVELLISDNASTDGTEAYLRDVSCRGLSVYRNARNIGADRNFLACVERASGTYIWLFGDDEVLERGGVARTLAQLRRLRPALAILRDGQQQGASASGETLYADYGACVRAEMGTSFDFALTHTLITANVFRKDAFDLKEAEARLRTNYAHMYGLLCGLRRGGAVAVLAGAFRTRPQRAQFDRWPTALCVKQAWYLWQLAGWFGVPRLRRGALRLALNLPLELLSCCAHRVFPKIGRT